MTRTWLSRVAQLLKAPKKSVPPAGRPPRLGVESLEDRAVPASYTFDATANTLLITLGTNEALSVTADATNTTFTLSGGTGTPTFTQNGGDPATGGSGATISIANGDLTGSLTVNNSGVTEDSNNDVTFAGGTVTAGTITVNLTDANGGSDRDDITISGGAALVGQASLSTQNGSISPTVSVGPTTTTVAEGGTAGTITFTRTGDTAQPLTVNFSVGSGSTATAADFTLSGGTGFTFNSTTGTGTVTFAAGSSTATLTVNVTDDTINENTETVVVNVGAATNNQYTASTTTGTATVSITDNDPNGNNNGNGPGNNNDNGTRTRKRPAFGGAFVLGDQMYLLDADGGIKAVVPVTRGTQVAFSDLTGDGAGDVITFTPLGSIVLDGQTGNILAAFVDFDGDRVPDILLYDLTTGGPKSVFLSRLGQSFPLS